MLILRNLRTLPVERIVFDLLARAKLARSIRVINGLLPREFDTRPCGRSFRDIHIRLTSPSTWRTAELKGVGQGIVKWNDTMLAPATGLKTFVRPSRPFIRAAVSPRNHYIKAAARSVWGWA
jgi:hypothetical protein